MQTELPILDIQCLVRRQVRNLFGFRTRQEEKVIDSAVEKALVKCDYCFSHCKNKYYHRDSKTYFNPFHSGQYSIFLYFLGRVVFEDYPDYRTLADRIYYLNKALNAVDLFYEVSLPAIFFVDHPLGSVMGRARYRDFFSFAQNCTVGNNKGVYPVIGRNVKMMAGSTLLGNCAIGDNVVLAARSYVKDVDIEPCSLVFGVSPNLVIKKRDVSYFSRQIAS